MKKIITFCLSLLVATTILAEEEWWQVTDMTKMQAGDEVVLACTTIGVTTGAFSSGSFGRTTTTFSEDLSSIPSLPSTTLVFVLGGEPGAWTLSSSGKLIGASDANALRLDKGTVNTWTITIDEEENAIITSTNTAFGSIQYNKSKNIFRNYTGTQTKVQLYSHRRMAVFSLRYKDYPYKKILCEEPLYKRGKTVKLSEGQPTREGHTFLGWIYDGQLYQPGENFIMPEENVELVACWDEWQAIDETPVRAKAKKMIRDGQLIIVRDGVEYNVIGVRVK